MRFLFGCDRCGYDGYARRFLQEQMCENCWEDAKKRWYGWTLKALDAGQWVGVKATFFEWRLLMQDKNVDGFFFWRTLEPAWRRGLEI